MVAENVVLDVSLEVGELAPQAFAHLGGRQGGLETRRGNPVSDAGRQEVGMPALPRRRWVLVDPGGEPGARCGEVPLIPAASAAQDLLSVMEVETSEPFEPRTIPFSGWVADAETEHLQLSVRQPFRALVSGREGGRPPQFCWAL
jgi:hypothetical protein